MMKSTFQVINRMVTDGVIGNYAVAGAVAAFNYLEPALTDDLDILVSIDTLQSQSSSGLVSLEPIFAYLRKAGYTEFRKEGVLIEGWPVQFLPVANPLDAESLSHAVDIQVEPGLEIRSLRAEHIVATALKVGRPKDLIRVDQFLAEKAVDLASLQTVLDRHGLREYWSKFCARTGTPDPFGVKS